MQKNCLWHNTKVYNKYNLTQYIDIEYPAQNKIVEYDFCVQFCNKKVCITFNAMFKVFYRICEWYLLLALILRRIVKEQRNLKQQGMG